MAVPVSTIHFNGASLMLGRCEVVHELPAEAKLLLQPHERDDFKAPTFLTTHVPARDQYSAQVRARDHFEEARALLRLIANDAANYAVSSHCFRQNDRYGFAFRITDTWVVQGTDENGVAVAAVPHAR